jgi:Transglutaminase-like superfamily
MRCPSCGRDVSDESFCEWCGKPLKLETSAPIELKSVPPSASKPLSPLPSSEAPAAVPATPTAAANKKPDNASSPPRWYGIVWGALAVVLYLAIADAAVETFLRDSPLRWWIAGAAALYLALCVAVWRLMPKLWRRLNWANQAALSLLVLLALMSATAWMPGGLEQGLNLFGQPTSIVLALVTAVVVALSGIFLARLHFVPLAGKIVAGLLAAYGVVAFLLAVNAGTPYPSLFHGGSQWTRLPFWLQGATVGALFLVPLALLLEIVTGLRQITRDKISDLAFKVVALGMSLVITVAAVRIPADTGYDAGAIEAPPWLTESHEEPLLRGEAGYKQASEKLNRMYAALDVVNSKIDRSLFEIDALAERLGSDPATIFHFVRDEIRYEPYVGVLRGPLGTLLCRAGNSLDRSLLLAALLQKAGLTAQIASGNLNSQQAQTLVNRLFEPVKPVPPAVPSIADLAPEISRAMGVDQAKLLQVSDEMQQYGQKQKKQLMDYVDSESKYLSDLLSKAGVDAGVITPNDQLVAEASQHYWVQYQNSNGQWIDLDSSFTDGEPGKTNAQVTNTFAPDSIPEELYHHLRVRLTLRVAQVNDGNDGETTDTVLLDQELRVAEQQGKDIVLANVPDPMPDLMKATRPLADALAATKGFQTVLQVGDKATTGKYFDLNGKLTQRLTGAPEAEVANNAGGIGGAFGALGGGSNDALGGAQQMSTSRIVGEWVEYKLTSPGLSGAAPEEHGYHRDIIAPVTATSWSARNAERPQVAPTHLTGKALRPRLMWSAELLAMPGTPIPDYAGYLALGALKAARPMLDASARLVSGLQVDPATFSGQSTASIRDLLLAEGSMHPPAEGSSNATRGYFARPGLIAYETRITDADRGVLTEGYDIVALPPRAVSNPTASASGTRVQAATIELQRGVLATRLEWSLMSSPASGERSVTNTTEIFAAAQKQGVPVHVLGSTGAGVSDLSNLSVPDSVKAELAGELAAGGTVIVPVREVMIAGRPQIGWWRWGTSGELIGIMPGERGQGLEEQIVIYGIALFGDFVCLKHIKADDPDAGDKARYCTMVAILGGISGVGLAAGGSKVVFYILAILSASYAPYV